MCSYLVDESQLFLLRDLGADIYAKDYVNSNLFSTNDVSILIFVDGPECPSSCC